MITHFGLDIGSESIKIAQVEGEKNSFRLVTAGIVKTPVPSLALESDKDLVAVAEAIKKLKNEIKVASSQVVTALPERHIFTQMIEMPRMNPDELAQAIPWEAENIVPQPLTEINLDWEIVEDGESAKGNRMKVLLVAAPKALIDKYLKVLKLAELEPLALETELLATVRCLNPIFNQGNLIIANLGLKSLDIAVIYRGSLFLTRSLPTAGEAITRALGTALNLDLATAEEYKKTYGLSQQAESKVASAIGPILAVIRDEIKKAIHFYTEKKQDPLRLLILSGGSSLLPGLTEYFAQSLNLEVQVADPLALIKVDEKSRQLLKSSSPLLTIALGLAMKE